MNNTFTISNVHTVCRTIFGNAWNKSVIVIRMITNRVCKCGSEYAGQYRLCPACRNDYMREWRKTHPPTKEQRMKSNARSYVKSYIRRGMIDREPCCICGTTENVETHHEDYSRPLDVHFVCKPHHQMVTNGEISLLPRLAPVMVKRTHRGIRQMIRNIAREIRESVPASKRKIFTRVCLMQMEEINETS